MQTFEEHIDIDRTALRSLLGHLGHALIPVGHGDGDAVGLRGRGELFTRAGPSYKTLAANCARF